MMQKKNLKEWAHCVIRLVIFLLIYVPMIFFFSKTFIWRCDAENGKLYPLLIPAGVIGWLVYDVAYRVFKRLFYAAVSYNNLMNKTKSSPKQCQHVVLMTTIDKWRSKALYYTMFEFRIKRGNVMSVRIVGTGLSLPKKSSGIGRRFVNYCGYR